MDRETVLQQFNTLEKKIEHLIKVCKQLEAANAELKQSKDQLATQLQTKIAAEKQNEELKNLVRSKIDSLMGRLDEFTEES